MSAILHCIVTDIENGRMKEQLWSWKTMTDNDPLIQKIRRLEQRAEATREYDLQMLKGWGHGGWHSATYPPLTHIVTDIENCHMKELLWSWKTRTDNDPLIRNIRRLEGRVRAIRECELQMRLFWGGGSVDAGNVNNLYINDVDINKNKNFFFGRQIKLILFLPHSNVIEKDEI